jgi:aryl-alcohol dehydrogenase-like predicted oxidoreductase
MVQPGVTAPIASATSIAQMQSLAKAAHLKLTKDDVAQLTGAGD